ncbi:MAG: fibronectin type III domain-containing protein [Bacteroidales bacterium]
MKNLSVSMRVLLMILLAFPTLVSLSGQSVSLSGTVKNASATGINGVQVKLKNHPLINTITNTSGSFTLTGSTGIDDPGEGKVVSFRGNGQVILHVQNLPVRIDIFNVSGQLLATILDVTSLSGDYQLNAEAYVSPDYTIYIVRVIAGATCASSKFIGLPGTCSKGLLAESPQEDIVLLKDGLATVDSLILEHTADYITWKIGIGNYVSNLGIITMEAKNVFPFTWCTTALAASSTQINLSWTDNASNESGFKIERAPGGTTGFTQIATVGAGVTTFQIPGWLASTSYSYRVRAYNFAEIHPTPTRQLPAPGPPVTVPAAPSGPSAAAFSSSLRSTPVGPTMAK